jgi:SAM-dependent methyltransferase
LTAKSDSAETYRDYERTRFTHDARRAAVWSEIMAFLEDRLGVPKTMLDLGAGYCDAINASHAAERHALDLRPEFVSHAGPGVITHVGTSDQLGGLTRLDWVLASNVFEHLTRTQLLTTIRAIRSALRPGGYLIVIQPNFKYAYREYFDDYTHLPESIFTEASLGDLLDAEHFELVVRQGKFLPFSMRAGLPPHPALVRAYLRSPWKPKAGQMLIVARKPLD